MCACVCTRKMQKIRLTFTNYNIAKLVVSLLLLKLSKSFLVHGLKFIPTFLVLEIFPFKMILNCYNLTVSGIYII